VSAPLVANVRQGNVNLEIGHHLDDGRWEQIGRAMGPNPAAAFSRWADRFRIEPGEYVVRPTDEDAWALFVADGEGLHPVDHF
jgi:hypothetical protein